MCNKTHYWDQRLNSKLSCKYYVSTCFAKLLYVVPGSWHATVYSWFDPRHRSLCVRRYILTNVEYVRHVYAVVLTTGSPRPSVVQLIPKRTPQGQHQDIFMMRTEMRWALWFLLPSLSSLHTRTFPTDPLEAVTLLRVVVGKPLASKYPCRPYAYASSATVVLTLLGGGGSRPWVQLRLLCWIGM